MPAEDEVDAWSRHMRVGNFSAAWDISDRVLAERRGHSCWHLPRHEQWIWDGSPVDGRDVLVRCYHGLGDTIQFARYLPLLCGRARSVTVWLQPRLMPLVATMEPFARRSETSARLLPLHDGEPGVDFEVDIEIMELAHAFRTSVSSIPASIPYFHVRPFPLRQRRRPAVGLVWQSGEWDQKRSIPFEEIEPLLEMDVDWYALQGGSGADRWTGDRRTLIGNRDIMEAAAAMRALDLVITIDSMPAHLAGALGTPVWTLLPTDPDWRWLNGRDDSPWYPTMRLFRQHTTGDWKAVVVRIRSKLHEWVAGRNVVAS